MSLALVVSPTDSPALPCPSRVLVIGRHAGKANSNICGEYLHQCFLNGRPAYRKQGSPTVIRYCSLWMRWVIDSNGFGEGADCLAFAFETHSLSHPAHVELVWNVWEPTAGAHVVDMEVACIDAPSTITLVGRCPGRTANAANGRYEVSAVMHGRPLYVHSRGDLLIRYDIGMHRWLLCEGAIASSGAFAFADAAMSSHPGCLHLEWQFWEPSLKNWVPDPFTRTVVAPQLLHVIGRAHQAESSAMNGVYHLAGIQDGRPLYVKPGSQTLIRYSAASDRWLIDFDGLAEPSLLSRLYSLVFTRGDAQRSEHCAAHAESCGTQHPGDLSLHWHVWESKLGRHVVDSNVLVTTAPASFTVTGRDLRRENSEVNGEYTLAGTHCRRPIYQKPGSRTCICFWQQLGRWLIVPDSLSLYSAAAQGCVAWAESTSEAEHPGQASSGWHVYESTRGCYILDAFVTVSSRPVQCHKASESQRQVAKQGALPFDQWQGIGSSVRHAANFGA